VSQATLLAAPRLAAPSLGGLVCVPRARACASCVCRSRALALPPRLCLCLPPPACDSFRLPVSVYQSPPVTFGWSPPARARPGVEHEHGRGAADARGPQERRLRHRLQQPLRRQDPHRHAAPRALRRGRACGRAGTHTDRQARAATRGLRSQRHARRGGARARPPPRLRREPPRASARTLAPRPQRDTVARPRHAAPPPGSFDKTAKLWDATTGELLHTLRGHATEIVCLAFDPHGVIAATGSMDSTAKVGDGRAPSRGLRRAEPRGRAAAAASEAAALQWMSIRVWSWGGGRVRLFS
jgi:hypothetical protein